MSANETTVPDEAVRLWSSFKKEQPELSLALSVLPVTGQIAAATEYYDAMQRGDSGDGVLAAIQFIPVIGKGLRSLPDAANAATESRHLSDLGSFFKEAKIGRNGESAAQLADVAMTRANALSKDVVSGMVSGATNFGEYLQSRINAAEAHVAEAAAGLKAGYAKHPRAAGVRQ
jgi:hypothetical protein